MEIIWRELAGAALFVLAALCGGAGNASAFYPALEEAIAAAPASIASASLELKQIRADCKAAKRAAKAALQAERMAARAVQRAERQARAAQERSALLAARRPLPAPAKPAQTTPSPAPGPALKIAPAPAGVPGCAGMAAMARGASEPAADETPGAPRLKPAHDAGGHASVYDPSTEDIFPAGPALASAPSPRLKPSGLSYDPLSDDASPDAEPQAPAEQRLAALDLAPAPEISPDHAPLAPAQDYEAEPAPADSVFAETAPEALFESAPESAPGEPLEIYPPDPAPAETDAAELAPAAIAAVEPRPQAAPDYAPAPAQIPAAEPAPAESAVADAGSGLPDTPPPPALETAPQAEPAPERLAMLDLAPAPMITRAEAAPPPAEPEPHAAPAFILAETPEAEPEPAPAEVDSPAAPIAEPIAEPVVAAPAPALSEPAAGAPVIVEEPRATLPPPPPGVAHPPMWRVGGERGDIWLLGSFHILPRGLDWRSPVVARAIERAETVWFEAEVDTPEARQKTLHTLMMQGFNPAGVTLTGLLGKSDAARLAEIAENLGVPMSAIDSMRPWQAFLTLSVQFIITQGFEAGSGVETALLSESRTRGRTLRFLETVEGQLALFTSLSPEDEKALLRVTLREWEKQSEQFAALFDAWRAGDGEAIDRLMNRTMRADAPRIYDILIARRNRAWADRIAAMSPGSGPTLIVVGAAHLVGEGSVPALLRARGIEVERVLD